MLALVLCLACLWGSTSHAAVLNVAVSGGNNDAEERLSNGNMGRNSSDLELVHDGNREQLVGMRFQNVTIPAGATINSAYIQFTVDEVDTGTTNVVLTGHDIGNAPIFTNGNSNLSNRAQTSASQTWSIAPWTTVGNAGAAQRTPDLAAIITEIISRGDWASGNAMVLLVAAGSGCNNSACQRTAESFNGVSASAPRLIIDYTVPASADLAVSQTDSPDPVNVGNSFAYTVTVSNTGPWDATGVTLVDTLPAGVTLQSLTPSQGTCSVGASINCSIGALLNGESAQVVIIVTASTPGVFSNTATVSAIEFDANPGNDTAIETTTVTSNVQQLCYLVADAGGGNGGNDLLTEIDTADFNPATNETNIGTGTGTNSIEAIAWNSASGVLYAANANRLGTLSLVNGTYNGLATFGTGTDINGTNLTFADVDGLAYDATTGVLYGVHARGGNDALFQINMATGTHVQDAFGPGIDYVTLQSVFGNTITDDIAVDPTTGQMYATVNSGGSTDRLVRVNKFTGTVQDIAQITVQDIEGLGTDPSGQLWGTSGTQGFLYEIDKTSGVGSFGRQIDNGSDYEAVDCYAISPSVSVDIGVSKSVDNPAPLENDTITYTLTATNTGSGQATSLQLSDILPGGVSFTSASASQGLYDSASGNWFVGALAAGATATLTITVSVDPGTGGNTVTNTTAVMFVSQNDPNSSNDSASVNFTVAGLQLTKNVSALGDLISTTIPKSIPGATMLYRIEVINPTSVAVDADSISIIDELPGEVALLVNEPGGPVTFLDGSPVSGLTYFFGGYASATDDIDFSNDTNLADGITWGYVPSTTGATDPDVTALRIRPQNILNGNSGGGDPGFVLEYKAVIE